MNKSGIDWCDFTWNPITGCSNGCPYCYARKQAQRFCGDIRLNAASPQVEREGGKYILEKPFKNEEGKTIPIPLGFAPTLHRYRLEMPSQKKKPATIFVCSMSDLFARDIPLSWIKDVIDECITAPQHRYMFLTKNPERYAELEQMAMLYRMKNFWYGTTITCQDDAKRIDSLPAFAQRFVSIEPMMGPVDLEAASLRKVHWIIAGAETGNRPGKTAPQKEWLEGLVGYAYKYSIPILLKDSRELREVWGNELIQEFPKGLEPMQPTYIPRCRECDHAETTAQGRRGTAYACGIGWEGVCDRGARSIPGRYTRTSPPWCPKRKEGKAE